LNYLEKAPPGIRERKNNNPSNCYATKCAPNQYYANQTSLESSTYIPMHPHMELEQFYPRKV
jgi:hypothetical protein